MEKPLKKIRVCLTPALGTLWGWELWEAVAFRNIGCSHPCGLWLAVLWRGPISTEQRDFQEKGHLIESLVIPGEYFQALEPEPFPSTYCFFFLANVSLILQGDVPGA